MFTLHDTFNDRTVSRHRTIDAAVSAMHKHDRGVKRANGPTAYIPIVILDADGQRVDSDDIERAIYRLSAHV